MKEVKSSLGDDGGGGEREVHQPEANAEEKHHRRRREKDVATRVMAAVTATPDYPESTPPPRFMAPPQPPEQAQPLGPLHQNFPRENLHIAPFYNKKCLNLQLRPLYTYPDSPFQYSFYIFSHPYITPT